jgi:ribosomal protein uS7
MVEVEAGTTQPEETGTQQLLFNRWDMSEVEIRDPSLARYVNLHAMIVPHSCGKLVGQQFNKSNMLIVERLINRMMQTENNTGKKELTIRIVREAFEIVNKKTKKNPVQVLVDAVANTGPREETVRLKYGGINVPKSVDTAPVHHRRCPAGEPQEEEERERSACRGTDSSRERRHPFIRRLEERRKRTHCKGCPLKLPITFFGVIYDQTKEDGRAGDGADGQAGAHPEHRYRCPHRSRKDNTLGQPSCRSGHDQRGARRSAALHGLRRRGTGTRHHHRCKQRLDGPHVWRR